MPNLKLLMEQRGWNSTDLIRELKRAVRIHEPGRRLPSDDSLKRLIRLWRNGSQQPEAYADLLSNIFGLPFEPAPAKPAVPDYAESLMAVASEICSDAMIRSNRLGPDVISQLHDQLRHLSRDYNLRPPATVIDEARALREMALQLVESTRRPSDQADLYAIASAASALIASMLFDMNNWALARRLASAGYQYADLAGHTSLEAWTLGLQATLDFWDDNPARALEAVERGLAVAPAGTARVRLLYIASRAHAVRGDADGAARVLAEAEDDRAIAGDRPDILHEEIGGEFRFDAARAAACAGATWLQLGDGERAERYTSEALVSFGESDDPQQFAQRVGTQIDTATARLLRGELAGAIDVVQPILGIDSTRRTVALVGRMNRVRDQLNEKRWSSDPEAVRLQAELQEWQAAAAT